MSEGMDSEDNNTSESDEITAGLSRVGIESIDDPTSGLTDLSGLPNILIVTHLDDAIFTDDKCKVISLSLDN